MTESVKSLSSIIDAEGTQDASIAQARKAAAERVAQARKRAEGAEAAAQRRIDEAVAAMNQASQQDAGKRIAALETKYRVATERLRAASQSNRAAADAEALRLFLSDVAGSKAGER